MENAKCYAPQILVGTEGLPREQWLEYRRKGIGGSDAAAVLGISPFRTGRDLYYDKLNIVIPVILLYAITFAFDSVPLLLPYDIRIIIQPRSANAITEIVTKKDFEITFCAWIVADSFLTLIGLARNKDIL